MNNSIWLFGLGLGVFWLFLQKKRLDAEALEALQLPSLRHNDRDWTALDELVLDIARHDVFARWHNDGRTLFLDTPEYDDNVEGGWRLTVSEFGIEIGDRYEELFPELCAVPRSKRKKVLRAAEAKSLEARKKFREMEIRHPDGTIHKFPSWMTM